MLFLQRLTFLLEGKSRLLYQHQTTIYFWQKTKQTRNRSSIENLTLYFKITKKHSYRVLLKLGVHYPHTRAPSTAPPTIQRWQAPSLPATRPNISQRRLTQQSPNSCTLHTKESKDKTTNSLERAQKLSTLHWVKRGCPPRTSSITETRYQWCLWT